MHDLYSIAMLVGRFQMREADTPQITSNPHWLIRCKVRVVCTANKQQGFTECTQDFSALGGDHVIMMKLGARTAGVTTQN